MDDLSVSDGDDLDGLFGEEDIDIGDDPFGDSIIDDDDFDDFGDEEGEIE